MSNFAPRTISALAADLRRLRTNHPAEQPLFFVIKSTFAATKGKVDYLTFSLANSTEAVSLEYYYNVSNLEVEYAKSETTDPAKIAANKNVAPTTTIVWDKDCITPIPGPPDWVQEIIAHNEAMIAANIPGLEANMVKAFRTAANRVAPADWHSDGTDLGFIIKEINCALKTLAANSVAVINDPKHPSNTEIFRAIAAPSHDEPPYTYTQKISPSDSSGTKWHGNYEPFYFKETNVNGIIKKEKVVVDRVTLTWRWKTPRTDGINPSRNMQSLGYVYWSKQQLGEHFWYKPVPGNMLTKFRVDDNLVVPQLLNSNVGQIFTRGSTITQAQVKFDVSVHGQGISSKCVLWSFGLNHKSREGGQDYGFGDIETPEDLTEELGGLNLGAPSGSKTTPAAYYTTDAGEDQLPSE